MASSSPPSPSAKRARLEASESGQGAGSAQAEVGPAATPECVCIVGSGNWGSAIARIIGMNAAALPDHAMQTRVPMWVYEEEVQYQGVPRKLSEVINEVHENVKYLPGVKLPDNVVAVPYLGEAVSAATVLVFVLPHQFLPRLLPQIKSRMRPDAKAISLIKGLDFDEKGCVLISDVIRKGLGVDVSVLMGANVAHEVAEDQFCEATIGAKDPANGLLFRHIFHTPSFHVTVVPDTIGVELCGALKNIVAIGAGFCDGLGFGGNTKAALIRIGLHEMIRFCHTFYPDQGVAPATFLQSCGIADLITTCYGGRNRKCAEAFVKSRQSWDELEVSMLGGQKLQGTLAAKEVYEILVRTGHVKDFPLFHRVYEIAFEGAAPTRLVDFEGAAADPWP